MISRSQTRNAPWLGSPFLHKLHTNNETRSKDIGAHSSRCVLKLELADQKKKELADPGRQPVIVRCRKWKKDPSVKKNITRGSNPAYFPPMWNVELVHDWIDCLMWKRPPGPNTVGPEHEDSSPFCFRFPPKPCAALRACWVMPPPVFVKPPFIPPPTQLLFAAPEVALCIFTSADRRKGLTWPAGNWGSYRQGEHTAWSKRRKEDRPQVGSPFGLTGCFPWRGVTAESLQIRGL